MSQYTHTHTHTHIERHHETHTRTHIHTRDTYTHTHTHTRTDQDSINVDEWMELLVSVYDDSRADAHRYFSGVWLCVCERERVCLCVRVYVSVCLSTCVGVCACECVCVYVCVCMWVRMHTLVDALLFVDVPCWRIPRYVFVTNITYLHIDTHKWWCRRHTRYTTAHSGIKELMSICVLLLSICLLRSLSLYVSWGP